MGETAALDLKGISGKTFVCCVWPVSLGRRQKSPLRERVAVRSRSSCASTTPSSLESPSAMTQCAPQVTGTVGVAEFAVREGDNAALAIMSNVLSTLTVSLAQSGGSVVTLLGTHICLSWNVTRSAPAHMENAIRFAQRMGMRSILNGAGLASGLLRHGDVGAHKQRFVTVMGRCVRRGWTLCELAVHDSVECLFEPPDDTTPLSALENVLIPYKGCYSVVMEGRDNVL